jgi:ferredoxin
MGSTFIEAKKRYLSVEMPEHERFAFGGESVNPAGYRITVRCTACGLCIDACPVEVISEGDVYLIDGGHCLECGRCEETCPEDAIEAAKGI